MEESKNNEEVDEMVNKNVIKKIWLMWCDFMISIYFFYNEKVIVQCAYDPVFARITEPSNNDYDNDGIDNCDHDFGTFDDFGVKYDPPPHSDNVRKKNSFSSGRCSLKNVIRTVGMQAIW